MNLRIITVWLILPNTIVTNMRKFLSKSLCKPLSLAAAALALASCGGAPTNTKWLNENQVNVAIDASFENVMREEMVAFTNKHIEAEAMPIYTSEDSVIWMLMKDSVRCGIATRKLTDEEKQYIKDVHHLQVDQRILAYDAFALIVNKANPDTVITTGEIRKIAQGEITRWEQLHYGSKQGELKLVFDQSGASTVRFIRDSLCNGKELAGNIFAAGSNLAVIDAVRKSPDVIGVVSADWLREAGAESIKSFRDLDVNVMLVSRSTDPADMSMICRPYQAYISTGEYPLVREVYIIHTDIRRSSMLKNFFFFMRGDGGQRLILNDSQLLPFMAVQERNVKIK